MEYYDWPKTFSYSKARWVMVISPRRYGKTYGLRKQCIRDYLKRKRRFVEVVRYKSEIDDIGRGYFDRLTELQEFPGIEFKYESNRFYLRNGEDRPWGLFGYIVALTDEQIVKRITFAAVKRFIFDEGLIEHKDRYKRYLPREYERLVGLRTSITNETPDNPSDSVVYILGNAVDYTCPYFENLGIIHIPEYGRHVYKGGDVLLDYVAPVHYDEFIAKTAVGRALDGTAHADALFANRFEQGGDEYVHQKPKGSKLYRAYAYGGHVFGLWVGPDSYVYVCDGAPKYATVKAFTLDDDRIDYGLIRKSGNDARLLRDFFYKKLLRYETALVRERFADMMLGLGIL